MSRGRPSRFDRLRITCLLALALAAPACGAAPTGDAAPVSASSAAACAPRLDPTVSGATLSRAHEAFRELGRDRGRLDAEAHITLRTRDGYRLRRLISTLLMGLGLFLAGALLGGLVLGLLGKRPTLHYARRLDEIVDHQLAALRTVASDASGSAERIMAQLEKPLLAAERRSERLLDLAAPLEERTDSDLARAQLAGLYAKLEGLADAVERLHLRATGWRDRLGSAVDEAAEAEAAKHIQAFTETVEALA